MPLHGVVTSEARGRNRLRSRRPTRGDVWGLVGQALGERNNRSFLNVTV
jgi:hypothetical protein